MKQQIIKSSFEEILSELHSLSKEDISKFSEGNYSITLRIIKDKAPVAAKIEMSESQKEDVLQELDICYTREEGHEVIAKYFKSRKELESFAKVLDVAVSRRDKSEQIKEKIIEATVGARLRSNAILGKSKGLFD